MKKTLRTTYLTVWAVLLVLFNVVAFALPTVNKFTTAYWCGYVLISLCFVLQLLCALKAMKAESSEETFYNLASVRSSFVGLIVSFVVGGLSMALPFVPYWVGIVACVVVLVFNVIGIAGATAAVEVVESVDAKTKATTSFLRTLTVEAQALIGFADADAKKLCTDVYEALRYSDPVSSEALAETEERMLTLFRSFAEAVKAKQTEESARIAAELTAAIAERNAKCKLFK